jgi:glycerol-3-phosphate dehydrogenase
MKTIHTEVLVIGGGATGIGVVRDLAMRRFKTLLVEKRDFSHGTTGRYHGVLHSGGRYVVKDPPAARECIAENQILRRIMPHCIEDTGGLFVITPWDNLDYAARFLEGCKVAGIPVEEFPIAQMLKKEPLLNPQISHCFRVPDGSADSFLAAHANVESARQHGATILNYHPVERLIKEGNRIIGATCRDLVHDEEVHIYADMVVNAAGAWTGKIASTVGIPVKIVPGKGVMIAVNHRIVNTIVNRCKMPSDGDILVPAHTVAVIGTTDVKVEDPDQFGVESWEIRLLLEEGDKLVPGFKDMRMLRAWAGVRPLYEETGTAANRDVTRAFILLDHETRDGVAGFVTTTSGKWTTYRKMAEVTSDLVCAKLGVQRPCKTHLEILPGNGKHSHHTLGARLADIEKKQRYGDLICECELVTQADVQQAILEGEAQSLDDIRRDVRLGMGPCQGGFCTLRAAGMLHQLRHPQVEETNAALRDFLQERWKGLRPVLWGQQLRQERLDELVYRSLLNTGGLPGQKFSKLRPEPYAVPKQFQWEPNSQPNHASIFSSEQNVISYAKNSNLIGTSDVLVIGAGLAGLTAAWQASQRGKRVKVISKGWGATHWHAGCIDVLGYQLLTGLRPIENLRQAVDTLIEQNPNHPYALAGAQSLNLALEALKAEFSNHGYPLRGSLEKNWLLPTALGSIRPSCLAPETMIAGDVRQQDAMLIIGFNGFLDFYPNLIADNLQAQGVPAFSLTIDLKTLQTRRFVNSRVLANLFEITEFRNEVAQAIKAQTKIIDRQKIRRIGFPAVLGIQNPLEIKSDLENQLGMHIFEIPTLPPSIPGIRLCNTLIKAIQKNGGHVYDGMQVSGYSTTGNTISCVYSEAASRQKLHPANHYVLATGGILGGGIYMDNNHHSNEVIFNLPVDIPEEFLQWFNPEFLGETGHPYFQGGIQVNHEFNPTNQNGQVPFKNLFAIGELLAYCDSLQERSLEGIALVSGFSVGTQLA